jgi:hypothetical protein
MWNVSKEQQEERAFMSRAVRGGMSCEGEERRLRDTQLLPLALRISERVLVGHFSQGDRERCVRATDELRT